VNSIYVVDLRRKLPRDESFYHCILWLIMIQMIEIEEHILLVQYNPK
jgi:hypothetical protein